MGFRTPTGVVDSEAKGGAFSSGIQDATSPNLGEPGPQGPQGPMGDDGAAGNSIAVVASAVDATEGGVDGLNITFRFESVESTPATVMETFFVPDGTDGMDGRSIVSGSVTDGVLTLVDSTDADIVVTGDSLTGDTGGDGPPGPQGRYDVRLFTAAATEPDSPTGLIWTASTNALTGANTDDWMLDPPDTPDGEELWEVIATFDPAGAATNITDWGNVFQAGGEGPAGPPGPVPVFAFDANTIPSNQDAFVSPVSGAGTADSPYVVTFNITQGNPGNNGLNGLNGMDGTNGIDGNSVTNIFFNTMDVTTPYTADADTITFEITLGSGSVTYTTFDNPFVDTQITFGSANTIVTKIVAGTNMSNSIADTNGVLTLNATDTNHTAVMFQNESTSVTGEFSILNFIGAGVDVTPGSGGIANIHITGGGGPTPPDDHPFQPVFTWDGNIEANLFVSVLDAAALSSTATYSLSISNIDPTIFSDVAGTLSGSALTTQPLAYSTNPTNFTFTIDQYMSSVLGTYTLTASISGTETLDTSRVIPPQSSSRTITVYAPYEYETSATEPNTISDFDTNPPKRFTGSATFTFTSVANTQAYVAVPTGISNPVFKSGEFFLSATNIKPLPDYWRLYRIDDYDPTQVGETLTVTLTDGG